MDAVRLAIRSAIAGVCVAGAASAATSEAPAAGRKASLEEITVTARRRDESLQDSPVSVTALSADSLRELGVTDLRGIASATPNMEFSYAGNGSGGGNFAQVFLRGVGQPDFIITKDPGVGIYVDGVYLARAPGSVLELLDVQQIEILRGPQGTLFGKNTEGGAVVVTTKKPTGKLGGVGEVTLGSYDRRDVSGSLEFPLVDGLLAGRVSAMSRTQDGYYKRLAYSAGGPASQFLTDGSAEFGNDTNRQSGRAMFALTPSDNFEVLLSADITKERQGPVEYQLIAVPRTSATVALANNIELYNRLVGIPRSIPYDSRWITTDPWTTYATWPGYNNSDIWGTSLTVNTSAGGVKIKSITGYRDLSVQTRADSDATPADIVSSGGTQIQQHQVSEELQFSGSLFSDRFEWITGLWYFKEKARDRQISRQQPGLFEALLAAPYGSVRPGNSAANCPGLASPATPTLAAGGCLGGAFNYNPNNLAQGNLSIDNTRDSYRTVETTSYAVYLHGSYAFTDQWSTSIGARFSREQKDFSFFEIRPLRALLPTSVNTVGYNDSRSDDNDIFTPKVGVEFKPTDDVMVYVQGSRGFKAGGFNSRPPSIAPVGADALQSFDAETLTSYELGLKSEWFDQRLRVNGAAFFSKYDDIQITRLTAIAGLRLEENAGDGEVKGGELEITAVPIAGLNLSAAVGYQTFEYTRLAAGVAGIALDNQLPFQAEVTGNLGISYAFSLGAAGDLTVRGDYRYSDRYFIDAENTLAVSQAPYDSFDARVAWAPLSGAWELFVQGINLTDEAVVANGVTSAANNSQIVTYKPPRQYAAGVRVNF